MMKQGNALVAGAENYLGVNLSDTPSEDNISPKFNPLSDDFTEQERLKRRALALAATKNLFSTDISKLDDAAATGLYQASVKGIFDIEDSDGSVAFGKRAAKNPHDNIELLRRFCKGEFSLIQDDEYKKWNEMDEMQKFKYALENETIRNKFKSYVEGERGASLMENLSAGFAYSGVGLPPGTMATARMTTGNKKFEKDAQEILAESARRSNYDTLTPEEQAAYRADVINDYDKKISKRQVLATFLAMRDGLSDRASMLLAKAYNTGDVDINEMEALSPLDRDRAYTALSIMRGDLKKGHILGIPTDLDDDTAFNRFQLGIYGFQQSVLGLATGAWDMGKSAVKWTYAKAWLDDAERSRYIKRWDAEVRAERALQRALPDADGVVGEGFQALMENLHWFIPYGMIGKGGKLIRAAQGVTEDAKWYKKFAATFTPLRFGRNAKDKAFIAETALSLSKAEHASTLKDLQLLDKISGGGWTKGNVLLARQLANIERYTQELADAQKAIKAAKTAGWIGEGTYWTGEAMAFSSFANEYIATCDAAGISRQDSVPMAAIIGWINAKIENIYVPGLESGLSAAEVKSLTFSSLLNAIRTDGMAGARQWLGNRVTYGLMEGAKVTLEEGAIEEPLQQIVIEHGKAIAATSQKLRENGQADLADQLNAYWDSIKDTAAYDLQTFLNTAIDMVPTSVGFGLTTIGNQTRRQHIQNAILRHENRAKYQRTVADANAKGLPIPAMPTMFERGNNGTLLFNPDAVDIDVGVADIVAKATNVRQLINKHWRTDDAAKTGTFAKDPNGLTKAITAARKVWNLGEGDVVRGISDAAQVDINTAEVLSDYFAAEAQARLGSPNIKAFIEHDLSTVDLSDESMQKLLPGYVKGSFVHDPKQGFYSGQIKLSNGKVKTIAYVYGDISDKLNALADEQSKIDSQLGKSYDARIDTGTIGGKRWRELDESERYNLALKNSNALSSGRSGCFTVADDNGKEIIINADDIIYLSNGELGKIGYGAMATQGTVRHETWHSIWRFLSSELSAEDKQQLAKTLGVDTTGKNWEVNLDEAMAHQFEQYASGNYVNHSVDGVVARFIDSTSGKLVRQLSKLGLTDEIKNPKTGNAYALQDFYDAVLRGEIGTGKLGYVQTEMPDVAPDKKSTTEQSADIPLKVSPEEVEKADSEVAQTAEKTEPEAPPPPTSTKDNYTLDNPAEAQVPNARFYRVSAGDGVTLVGELVVSDASQLKTSYKGNLADSQLQNRGETQEGRALVEKIAGNPLPLEVGTVQPRANNGFIWTTPSLDVFIGNTRASGVTLAYDRGNGAALNEHMRQEAQKRGIEIPEGVKHPVVHFVLRKIESEGGKANIYDVVRMTNESVNRGMNKYEQAKNDADVVLKNNLASGIVLNAEGNIDTAKSATAIGTFRQLTNAQGLIDENTDLLSEEGQARLKNAVLATILNGANPNLLARIISQAKHLDIENELNAIMRGSSEMMKLATAKPQYDLQQPLAEALDYYVDWRDRDEKLRAEAGKDRRAWSEKNSNGNRKHGISWQQYMGQGDMFRTPSPEARIIGDLLAAARELRSFDKEDNESSAGKIRAQKFIDDYLNDYIANAYAANTETVDMFGTPPPTRLDIMNYQRTKDGATRFSTIAIAPSDAATDPSAKAYLDALARPDANERTSQLAPNGKRSNLTNALYHLVRTKRFKDWFGDWEKKAILDKAVEFALNGKPVASITGNEFTQNGQHDLVDRISAFYASIGGKVKNQELGDVILDRDSARSSLGHGIGREKAAAFAAVPDVIRNGFIFDRQENWKGRGVSSFALVAPIKMGNDIYVCEAIVEQKGKGKERRFYLHEVNLQSSLSDTIKTPTGGASIGKPSRPVRSILAKLVSDFNLKSVSKVVDENGEPMVVSHASDMNFNSFDMSRFGKHDWGFYGAGIYFSATTAHEKQYGNVNRHFFLNLRNPYDFTVGRGRDEITDYYNEMGKIKTYDEKLKYAKALMDKIAERGYDGAIANYGIEYISYNPSQVKSADPVTYDDAGNVVPLSQRFNQQKDDIRFSTVAISPSDASTDPAANAYLDALNRPDANERTTLLAPNGKCSNLTNALYHLVRTKRFKDWFGDWDNYVLGTATESECKATVKNWRDARKEFRNKANGRVAELKSDWTKLFSSEAKGESDNFEAHYAAIMALDRLFENSVKMWGEKPRNSSQDISEYTKYGHPFVFNGDVYLAKMTVKEYAHHVGIKDGFYSIEAVSVEKINATGNNGDISVKGRILDRDVGDIIAKRISKCKRVSKVVDENGEPLAMSVQYELNGYKPLKNLKKAWTVSTLPAELAKEISSWKQVSMSPYSYSFYDSHDISWSKKPNGSLRVSDHWNFISRGEKHCKTDIPIENGKQWALGKYDADSGEYKILKIVDAKNDKNPSLQHQYDQSIDLMLKAWRDGKRNFKVFFNSEDGSIKSADPVTYDDAGNIIPLSQRFSQQKNDIRFSISHLYTGSAADYANRVPVLDKDGKVTGYRIDNGPSLLKIGTGEGSQVYGHGLYASESRGVAEGYADAQKDIYQIDGKPIEKHFIYNPKTTEERALSAYVITNGDKKEARRVLVRTTTDFYGKKIPAGIEALKWFDKNKDRLSTTKSHLYEQTFFTNRAKGDESHLLSWYDLISEENLERIKNELSAEGIDKKFGGMYWLRHHGMSRYLESRDITGALLDNGSTGDAVYETLSLIVGGPKATSEFLVRADIDGIKYPIDSYGTTVKDGDKVGWNYVSFRDDNIRVDHKWVDGKQRFSISASINPDIRVDVVDGRIEPAFNNLTTGEIRNYLRDRYQGREVTIRSDGTVVEFIFDGLTSALKKRNKHRRALHRLDKLVENSHFTRYENNDGQKKHKHLNGQFIYTAALRLNDGIYGVELKLDDPIVTNKAQFKGQTLKTKIADAVLSVGPRSKDPLPTSDYETSATETIRLGDIAPALRSITNADESNKGDKKQLRFSAAAPLTVASAFPRLDKLSDVQLISAAIASKTVFGKSGKAKNRYANVNQIQRYLKAQQPNISNLELAQKTQDVLHAVRDISARMKEDLDRGVSQSQILQYLPDRMRDVFASEMTTEAAKGANIGSYHERASRMLEDKATKVLNDAVAVQSGVESTLLENTYGIDFSQTLMDLAENPYLKKDGQGNFLPLPGVGSGFDAESTPPTTAKDEREVSQAIKKAVDEIAQKSAEQLKEEGEQKKTSRLESNKDDDSAGLGNLSESDIAAIATRRAGVDLQNPRQLALFIAELARRWWVEKNELDQNAEAFRDRVALQFLRKTAANIYNKLVREITYSQSRDSATQAINGFEHVPTLQGLLSEMTFVGQLINARRIRETQQQMCEKLDQLLREKFGATGHFKADREELRRKVSAEMELRARYMRHAMWLTPNAAGEEAQRLRDELDMAAANFEAEDHDANQSKTFTENLRKLNILREFGALRYKPLATIESALNYWDNALEGETDAIVRANYERDVRTKMAAELLARAFHNPKQKSVYHNRGSLALSINEYIQGHMSITHLLRDMMRFAAEADATEAEKIVKWLELEIQKAGTRASAEKRRHANAFAAAIQQIYGRSFERVIADFAKQDERFAPFMGMKDGIKIKPTKGRAIQLMVSLLQVGHQVEVQNPDNPKETILQWVGGYHDNIVKHHREGQAQQISALLSPADLNLVKWLGQWYEMNRQDLSDVCQNLFGIGVYSETWNYFPVKMLLDKQGLEKGEAVGWSVFPKALSPRVRNERDFDTEADILQMFMSRMEEAAQWKAHAKLGLELRGIFGRTELQNAVIASHGAKANSLMLGFITDTLSGHGTYDRSPAGVDNFGDKIRGWAAIGALGGNVGVMFKQTTSIPAFGFEIGLTTTARHMMTAFTPAGFAAMNKIWNSEERKIRWDVGNSEAVKNALATNNKHWFMRIIKSSMITNKIGDCVPGLVIGQGIYRDALDRGMSEEDAMSYTWMLIERTQQSSRIENQPSFMRRSKFGRMLYQFLSTQGQYLQYEARAIRKVIANPSLMNAEGRKRWKELGRAAILNHFILSSAYFWMGQLYKSWLGQEPPEDELADWIISCLLGPYGALYCAGFTTAEALNRWVKGKSYASTNTVPSLNWISNIIVHDPCDIIDAIMDDSKTYDDVKRKMVDWAADFNAAIRDLVKIYRWRVDKEPQ